MKSLTSRLAIIALLVIASVSVPVAAAAQSAQTLYTRALGRERALRDDGRTATLKQLRAAVSSYENLVHRFPTSPYSDNALWQGGNLALLAYDQYKQASDKKTGLRLLGLLRSQYPSSSLSGRAGAIVRQREQSSSANASATPPSTPTAKPSAPSPDTTPVRAAPPPLLADPKVTAVDLPPLADPAPASSASTATVLIRDVKRTDLPDGVRITMEMDGEATFRAERVENPDRVFFDVKNATAASALADRTVKFSGDLVREVRFGRHPGATRVVVDLRGAESYSVFTLYEPFRVVVDVKRSAAAAPAAAVPEPKTATAPPPSALPTAPTPTPAQQVDAPLAKEAALTPASPPPASIDPASTNSDGKFSLARQLGLGVSRIVIDPGHGGHDPGANANGLTESELTLDIALRLQKLLAKQPGVDVVMTRATDVFIPLEERTRIANREGADLFLSIHANASRNTKARGVETYFLNFATNPDAEAVAARENAGSGQSMHKLPDIVRAIALNNKIDESRDFADMVQRSMVRRLSNRNKDLRDIGVKQAPFVVLIGAEMPSVLAEMSFVTNRQDAALLKTGAYRQQIAEALHDAVVRYQQSLKKMRSASSTSSAR
ncbi:MAG TPA: N-acetylmuramoyl-L-alanine amidase [Vicinamibacterales bacterium]|nr:N-acetylmuramoyl-L-alanine amidase [Vicinamibacterales bacterium]